MVQIFPSILPDGESFVDDTYSRAELDRMDGRELQSLAAEHPTDECNGSDKAAEIRDVLVGKQRI
jgi:hypothetical protein